jgi:hypothetical protein
MRRVIALLAAKADWVRAAELGAKGLAWGDSSNGVITLWSAWKGSVLEEALWAAEQLMEALRSYIAELNFAVGHSDEPAVHPHTVAGLSPLPSPAVTVCA